MHTNRRLEAVPLALIAAAGLLVVFSLAAPWAAAFPSRPDHYKVTLFGIRHITDMTATSSQTSCTWGDAGPCSGARSGDLGFAALTSARWLVFGGIMLMVAGAVRALRGHSAPATALTWALAPVMLFAAVVLVRTSVTGSLDIFRGATAVMPGSGMSAATAAAVCIALASLTTAIRASRNPDVY